MAGVGRFEDLRAWQIARALVTQSHHVTRKCRIREDAELRTQLHRATVSMMSNIAEGFGRGNDGDFLRFLDIARASAVEVQSLLYVCEDLGYLSPETRGQLHRQAARCLAAIAGLQNYLREVRRRRE